MPKSTVGEISNELKESVRDTLNGAGSEAAKLAAEARHAVDAASQKVAELADDLAHEAGARSRQAARYAAREVRDHPATTIAVGAAIGVLAAILLTRRR